MSVEIVEESILILNVRFDSTSTTKVGIFDLDSTLLKYYPNRLDKFEYMYPTIPDKLREIHQEGYKLIVVSNQSSISEEDLIKLKLKLNLFIKDLNLPILIILCLKRDKYRKPGVGTFQYLTQNFFDQTPSQIFFVGDAAGPRENSYPSYFDIKYAYNCNIPFFTPEEYFLNSSEKASFNLFDVTKYTGKFVPKYSEYIFVYGFRKYTGIHHFIKRFYPDYKISTDNKLSKKTSNDSTNVEKTVFINCNKISLLMNQEIDSTIYVLDYPNEIVDWCKGFFYTSGMFKTRFFEPVKTNIKKYLENNLDVEKVPFIYDESEFTEEQKKIARLQL